MPETDEGCRLQSGFATNLERSQTMVPLFLESELSNVSTFNPRSFIRYSITPVLAHVDFYGLTACWKMMAFVAAIR